MNELKPTIKATENLIKNQDKILREVATSMLAVTSNRIFNQGKDSKGSQIGRYSKGYIKQRAKKGLGTNPAVKLVFTRQMQNDFSVVQEGKTVGLGFKNQVNADKAGYVEGTYNKEIFTHTEKEISQLINLYGKIIERNFK